MKPLFLELQAFGPFVDKQTIDFEKLSQSGVFLIKGETGSGKTTIFDAMSFALYGAATGESEKTKGGRNDLSRWRCNQAADKEPTVVAFTFESGGKKYRFTRKYFMRRSSFSTEFGCVEIGENGEETALFNNPKEKVLNEKAAELVGLNHDQFCQVVMLPQGKFERFLVAESAEKEKILGNIFSTHKWGEYARSFSENAKARLNLLKDKKRDIESRLKDEGLASVEELAGLIADRKQQLADLEQAHKDFNGAEKQKLLDEEKNLSHSFAELHRLERVKQQLSAEKPQIDSKEVRRKQAERAEELRKPIEDSKTAEKEKNIRANGLALLQAGLPAAQKAAKEANEEYESKKSMSPVEKLSRSIGELEGKKEIYGKIDGLKAAWAEANRKLRTAGAAASDAEDKLGAAVQKAAQALREYNDAEDSAKSLRNRYFAGIYGEIASGLVEGEKCPVCGSTHHPDPAEKAEGSVSKPMMEAGATAAEGKKKLWDAARKAEESARLIVDDRKAGLTDAQRSAAGAEADYNNAKGSLIPGIADSGALEEKIRKFRADIQSFEKQLKVLENRKNSAAEALTRLNADIDGAKRELENALENCAAARQTLAGALAAKGFADPGEVEPLLLDRHARDTLLREVTDYNSRLKGNANDLAAMTEALAGKTEPDAEQLKTRQEEITGEDRQYSENRRSLSDSINRLSDKYKKLADMSADYYANINQAESDVSYANALTGVSGISLERYVLGIMFDQVLGEANRMLQNMHGGRYYLERSNEAEGSGNKSGLDLLVHDSRSPEGESRSVRMLSGGEKFLVSLALSIGLSHYAQKSGVRIEALFIDEGFGTLDDSSINDAMTILETVRGKSGVIGIISHVSLLEGTIGTHLEVVKTENGNYIKPV